MLTMLDWYSHPLWDSVSFDLTNHSRPTTIVASRMPGHTTVVLPLSPVEEPVAVHGAWTVVTTGTQAATIHLCCWEDLPLQLDARALLVLLLNR